MINSPPSPPKRGSPRKRTSALVHSEAKPVKAKKVKRLAKVSKPLTKAVKPLTKATKEVKLPTKVAKEKAKKAVEAPIKETKEKAKQTAVKVIEQLVGEEDVALRRSQRLKK